MKNAVFLILGLAVILGSIFLFLRQNQAPEKGTETIKINGVSIEVEVVETPEARRQGLSGRTALPEGTGMLFIFEEPQRQGFWMKDMYFSIDIVWIDENSRIIGIEKEVTPETFPQVFYSPAPVKYVLEVPAGFTERHSIEIGAVVQ